MHCNCISNCSRLYQSVFFKWKGGFRMLKELLELSKTTDIVAEDTVEGAKGNVANYDCDP